MQTDNYAAVYYRYLFHTSIGAAIINRIKISSLIWENLEWNWQLQISGGKYYVQNHIQP